MATSTPKKTIKTNQWPTFLCLLGLFILLFLLPSCNRGESLQSRNEEFKYFLVELQNLENSLEKETRAQEIDPQPIITQPTTQPTEIQNFVDLYENGELTILAEKIDALLEISSKNLIPLPAKNSTTQAKLPREKMQELAEKEAIDFFSTLQILQFYYNYMEKKIQEEPVK